MSNVGDLSVETDLYIKPAGGQLLHYEMGSDGEIKLSLYNMVTKKFDAEFGTGYHSFDEIKKQWESDPAHKEWTAQQAQDYIDGTKSNSAKSTDKETENLTAKVGDTVKYVGHEPMWQSKVGVIAKIDLGDAQVVWKDDGIMDVVDLQELEKVEDTPKTEFKAGDSVVWKNSKTGASYMATIKDIDTITGKTANIDVGGTNYVAFLKDLTLDKGTEPEDLKKKYGMEAGGEFTAVPKPEAHKSEAEKDYDAMADVAGSPEASIQQGDAVKVIKGYAKGATGVVVEVTKLGTMNVKLDTNGAITLFNPELLQKI